MNAPVRTPFNTLAPAQQAGILCNDPRFQKFAASRCGLNETQFSTSAAAQFVRDICRVDSRKRLNFSSPAQQRFNELLTAFDAWTGKIATPR